MPKKAYLRERSPCPRFGKLSRFQTENKSKNSFTLKKYIKKELSAQKILKTAILR